MLFLHTGWAPPEYAHIPRGKDNMFLQLHIAFQEESDDDKNVNASCRFLQSWESVLRGNNIDVRLILFRYVSH